MRSGAAGGRALLAASALACAGAGPVDPDWPCMQRLVPSLTAGTLWPGHAPAGDWHADPRIAALVQEAARRGATVEAGVALITQFAATRPGAEALAEVFAGLVEQTNLERAQAIERLRQVGRRQRALADATSRLASELSAMPADAPTAEREERVNRRALMIRQYEEVDRTIRYACEIPVQLEARLGRFAQTLQRALDD